MSNVNGVIDILEAVGIEYMMWGGVAAVAYGEPRFTYDLRMSGDTLDRYSIEQEAAKIGLLGVWRGLWEGFGWSAKGRH